jgi:hypothetical protein
MISREMPGQDYGADLIPANPTAHPADWEFTIPLEGFLREERVFLSEWLPQTWGTMTAFLEAREKKRCPIRRLLSTRPTRSACSDA